MSFDGSDSYSINQNNILEIKLCHRLNHSIIETNFMGKCVENRKKVIKHLRITNDEANNGELLAFATYAAAFPENFVGLVDTYDVLKSGLINFISVALALNELEYSAIGIRIDSGDLAYLSR